MEGSIRRGIEHTQSAIRWASGVSERRFFLAVFLPVAATYLATTSWGLSANVDVMTNSYTAWSLGTTGSPVVHQYTPPPDNQDWIAFLYPRSGGGTVSPYPPGAPLLAAPIYFMASKDLNVGTVSRYRPDGGLTTIPLRFPDIWPGSVAAALTSAGAVAFLGLTLRTLRPRAAFAGAMVAAFGTSIWSVASDSLWQHGPALFWLSLAMYLLHSRRWWAAGLAFAGALVSRQLTGVIAASAGLSITAYRRSLLPAMKLGTTTSIGLFGLSAWYLAFWDTIAPWGPRVTQAVRAVTTGSSKLAGDFITDIHPWQNQFLGAFEPGHGFMILSSFLLVAVLGLRDAWRVAPPATKACALGGLAYYIVQHRIQIYAHDGYFGYRYPLEALLASGPLWFLAFRSTLARFRRVSMFSVKLSIGVHAVFAIWG